jgi:hypothetical protein
VVEEMVVLQRAQHRLLIQMRRDVGTKSSPDFITKLENYQSKMIDTLNRIIEEMKEKYK